MKWTDKELRFIRDNYKKLGATEIVKRLNLSNKLKHPRDRIKSQYCHLKRNNFQIRPYIYSKKPYEFPDITQAELGYIAGFMDGEGCLTFSVSWNKNGTAKYCFPMLQVGNKNPKPTRYVADLLKLSFKPRRLAKINYLNMSGAQRIKELLVHLIPHLILKKEQAQLMLKFLKQHEYKNWTLSDWELVLKHTEANAVDTHPKHLEKIQKLKSFIKELKA